MHRPAAPDPPLELRALSGKHGLHETAGVVARLLQKQALEQVSARDERAVDCVEHPVDRSRFGNDLSDGRDHRCQTSVDLYQLNDRRDQEHGKRQNDYDDQDNHDCEC